MGGMGFIVSNQAVLLYNNTMISFNMLEAARQNAAKRYFYSSTACVYNEALQMDPENVGLTEDMVGVLEACLLDQPISFIFFFSVSFSSFLLGVACSASRYLRSGEALRRGDGHRLRQGLPREDSHRQIPQRVRTPR